jgi:hypothetical protein
MTLHKWFDDEETKERMKKKEDLYDSLADEDKKDLKKKTIKNVIKNNTGVQSEIEKNKEPSDFLHDIVEFKKWLDTRTYLKGDLDRIETWIKILYQKIDLHSKNLSKENERETLIEEFRKIPPELLEEKARIALNKKLRGVKSNSSDNYYLRKLKLDIDSKLTNAKYYKILKKIFEI